MTSSLPCRYHWVDTNGVAHYTSLEEREFIERDVRIANYLKFRKIRTTK